MNNIDRLEQLIKLLYSEYWKDNTQARYVGEAIGFLIHYLTLLKEKNE